MQGRQSGGVNEIVTVHVQQDSFVGLFDDWHCGRVSLDEEVEVVRIKSRVEKKKEKMSDEEGEVKESLLKALGDSFQSNPGVGPSQTRLLAPTNPIESSIILDLGSVRHK